MTALKLLLNKVCRVLPFQKILFSSRNFTGPHSKIWNAAHGTTFLSGT